MLRKQKKLMMPAAAVLPSLLLARNPVPRELGLLTTQKTVVCTSEKGYYFVQEDRASSLASKRWQISRMFLSGIAGKQFLPSFFAIFVALDHTTIFCNSVDYTHHLSQFYNTHHLFSSVTEQFFYHSWNMLNHAVLLLLLTV
jgi:hypothetical protein